MVGRVIPIRCCVCVFECGSVRAFVNVDGVREHVLGIVMKYRRTNCELFSMVILEKKLIITIVATDGCGLLVSLSAIITTHVHFILGVHSGSDDAIATFTYRVLAHNTVDLEECVASLIKHQAVKTADYVK